MNETGTEKTHTVIVSIDSPVLLTLKLSIDALEVLPEDARQLIEWKLDDALAKGGGEFVGLEACRPGFEWLSVPPPAMSIFDKATRPKKDALQLRDTHKKDGSSSGAWMYKLRVSYDGKTYETPVAIGPAATGETRTWMLVGSNPIIINR